MKRVIQNRRGQRKGERGIKVLFLHPEGKSKSFSIHGYSLEDAYNAGFFLFNNETILNTKTFIGTGKTGGGNIWGSSEKFQKRKYSSH